jgi:hypothetical protein
MDVCYRRHNRDHNRHFPRLEIAKLYMASQEGHGHLGCAIISNQQVGGCLRPSINVNFIIGTFHDISCVIGLFRSTFTKVGKEGTGAGAGSNMSLLSDQIQQRLFLRQKKSTTFFHARISRSGKGRVSD